MRSILLFVLSIIVVSVKGQMTIGLRGEVSLNHALFVTNGSVTGNGKSISNKLVGFSIAPSVEVSIFKKGLISIESSYALKGYRFKLHNFFDQKKAVSKNTFHYLLFNSIYLHDLDLTNSKRKRKAQKIYSISGLYLGTKLFSKWKPAGSTSVESPSFEKIDFGFILGMRYYKKHSKRRAYSLSIRYFHGLINIADHPNVDVYLRSLTVGVTGHFLI